MSKKYNSSLSHFADDFIFISNSNNNLKYITRQQSKKRQDWNFSILLFFSNDIAVRISGSGYYSNRFVAFSRDLKNKHTITYYFSGVQNNVRVCLWKISVERLQEQWQTCFVKCLLLLRLWCRHMRMVMMLING